MKEITPEESVAPVYLAAPTKAEIKELEKLAEEQSAQEAAFAAEEASKKKNRDSALAKLAKLGLTVDEIQSLIP